MVLLALLLGYRLLNFALTMLPGVDSRQWLHWGGAALAGVALVPIALWRQARPTRDQVPGRLVNSLIVALIVFQILLPAVAGVITAIFLSLATSLTELTGFNYVMQLLNQASTDYRAIFNLVVALAGVIVTVVALRRKRDTVAAYGMILAWTQVIAWLTDSGRPLEVWSYTYADMDVLLLLTLAALATYWLVRRQLTDGRALQLFSLAFFGWLLNNTSFIKSPYSILFGFAGVFFLVFSLFWSVITAGGKFANIDSPRFPRTNRLLLYLGYVLITVSVTHWYVVSHDVYQQTLNTDFNFSGFRIFGLALAYLVFVEGGRALLKEN